MNKLLHTGSLKILHLVWNLVPTLPSFHDEGHQGSKSAATLGILSSYIDQKLLDEKKKGKNDEIKIVFWCCMFIRHPFEIKLSGIIWISLFSAVSHSLCLLLSSIFQNLKFSKPCTKIFNFPIWHNHLINFLFWWHK